jgi:hypothetical protein
MVSVAGAHFWAIVFHLSSFLLFCTNYAHIFSKMIVTDLRSYSCVEDQGFVNMMKVAVPGYTIPSKTTFSRKLVPSLYETLRSNMIETLKEDFHGEIASISFTTDGWRSRSGDCYNSLTCHYLTDTFLYREHTLAISQLEEKHTGDNLRRHIECMLDDWEIPHRDSTVKSYTNIYLFFFTLPFSVGTFYVNSHMKSYICSLYANIYVK